MDPVADLTGPLSSHMEVFYRPAERDLAIQLVEALGCTVSETVSKSCSCNGAMPAIPHFEVRDSQKNLFYMSPVRHEQLLVEEQLEQLVGESRAFSAVLDRCRQTASTRPLGTPPFALSYVSDEAVRQTEARINGQFKEKLGDRLRLRIFYPGDEEAAGGTPIQGFLLQDVIVSGMFLLGQVIELHAQPSKR